VIAAITACVIGGESPAALIDSATQLITVIIVLVLVHALLGAQRATRLTYSSAVQQPQ
jgi:hypothetical protein